MFGCLLKLMLFPLYIPLYFIWSILGGLLGMKHQHYDIWRW